MKSENFIVEEKDEGTRLDLFLKDKMPELSRSVIVKTIEDRNVLVNSFPENKNYRVKNNDKISFIHVTIEKPELKKEYLNLKIEYEDVDLMVVQKPKGMVIYPTPNHSSGTFANGLLSLGRPLSNFAGNFRPGIVHRLDKDTSGLIVIAKNNTIHEKLVDLMIKKEIIRIYHGVSFGDFKEKSGYIEIPIGRYQKNRTIMSTKSDKLRSAKTNYKVIEQFENYTYLELMLETGRKHQIRVHLNSINRPLAGEKTYNFRNNLPVIEKPLEGQCLHAKILKFIHPNSNLLIKVECELPDYFKNFLSTVK